MSNTNKTILDYNRNELTVLFVEKDNNYQNESTTYWFNVDEEVFGVVESTIESSCIVDSDSCRINTDDAGNVHLKELVNFVTEDLRDN